ncbi:MAG: bifunctional UDP-N-acetylglucosamine diphosphorylase/glucosamine-1-phosphate N-acetyltransferase GlmU [Sporichthyaceae bacterium]
MGVVVVVLAAGEGKRMKSALPKVLHPIGGRSLLGHALAAARGTEPEQVVVVVGHGRDQVGAHLERIDPAASTVVQEQQNGTGHAVRVALGSVAPTENQTVLVVCGDVPLLRAETLAELLDRHAADGNAVTVLTAVVPDPTGYGRILRAPDGGLEAIVEQRDATPEQHKIAEINSGVYAFDGVVLRDALGRLSTDNSQGEEYLTDVVSIARRDGARVGASLAPDHREILGVNDRAQLAELGKALNDRVVDGWMRAGVTVIDPATAWIDVQVQIEPDAVIAQNTQLHGATRIGTGAKIGPNTTLTDVVVGAGASVLATHGSEAVIGPDATVGPFTYLRPGTKLGDHTKAGAFVEVKNSTVGTGSKIPHLSYVGDGDIGEYSNIGCATVFVNYDGVAKHRTVVGDHVRVGSDTMLVAPLTLGDGSYTAAGSVVTKDVPPGALAVARGTQRNVDNWVVRARPGSKAAAAAEAAQRAAERSQE